MAGPVVFLQDREIPAERRARRKLVRRMPAPYRDCLIDRAGDDQMTEVRTWPFAAAGDDGWICSRHQISALLHNILCILTVLAQYLVLNSASASMGAIL